MTVSLGVFFDVSDIPMKSAGSSLRSLFISIFKSDGHDLHQISAQDVYE
jgi:hypothetical protein